MSDLNQAIADVIAEHLGGIHGGILTSFTACIGFIDSDGDRCIMTASHDGQSIPETLGLLRWHTIQAEAQVQDALYEGDGNP